MMDSFDNNLEHIILIGENKNLIHKSEPFCGKCLYYFILCSFSIVLVISITLMIILYI